jgi:uncharacterized membrane protein
MSASVWTEGYDLNSVADRILNIATRFWFLIAVGGQWMFAYYVAAFYGGAAMRGDLRAWNKVMPHGYVPGDVAGNLAIAAHLFLAFVIIVGGPLQLIPQIRRYAPAFHRWNGRVYMPAVFVTSLAGLYMIWFRNKGGAFVQYLGITLDAILIMVFAVLAVRYAMAGQIQTHRRWALRLFMVVNAVWFFRVGLMFWLVVNQGPAGFDPETFRGPFLSFWAFADYLLPLAVLELYFRTRDRAGAAGRLAMAAVLFVVTVALGIGIVVAAKAMWLPRL